MLRKIGLLAVALTLTVGALPTTAHAHHRYPDKYWAQGASGLIVRLHSNTTWSPAQVNAIAGALQVIEDVPNSNVTFNFDDGPKYNWQDPCNLIPHILIEKVGVGHVGGAAATVYRSQWDCGPGVDPDKLVVTRIQIETPNDIYWGDNVPEPIGDVGARGILTHELIHTLGFLGGPNEHWDQAMEHDSWCEYNNGQGAWRTMCNGGWYNASQGVVQYNRNYTLHNDDETYLQWRY